MSDYTDFWGEDNWGFAFGERDRVYTLGYHIGQDVLTDARSMTYPVLTPGVVVQASSGSQIGYYFVLEVEDGTFHTYCHLKPGTLPAIGSRPTTATSGGPDDFLGTATGPHLHFVASTAASTAYAPVASQVIDPRPIIRGQLASPAGGNARPVPNQNRGRTNMLLTRDNINENAVLAGALFPPTFFRKSELGEAYHDITAQEASLWGENPNRFDGEVLDAIAKRGEFAHAEYFRLYGNK